MRILWADGPARYGWFSIGLHWLGAGLVLALLFIGGSIGAPGASGSREMLGLHVSLAVTAYALLATRVAWRLAKGHPQRLPRQGATTYAVGRYFHYALLLALAAMLVSGPLMGWSGMVRLEVWGWPVPRPSGLQPQLFEAMHAVHFVAANVLGWGTLAHVLAVTKHVAIDRDGALGRMLTP